MIIKIPAHSDFDFYACKKMFKKYQKEVGDNNKFNEIIKNTFFYSFYDNKILVGCIYVYEKENSMYINGFAIRKFYEIKKQAIKKITEWFDCDIYAESYNKAAVYMLLRSGFKKIKPNIFVYKK